LVESINPMIRLSEDHDSGWGIASYRDVGQAAPISERFALAAHNDNRFTAATDLRGRIFNVHVRRATLGGLSDENTHPFEFGPYTFAHNGTILGFRNLLRPAMGEPVGQTDSECFFMRLMHDFDPIDPVRSLRATVAAIIAGHTFSGLNFVFSDGQKLYAYKLGIFDLHWAARDGSLVVASERITADDAWHSVQDDVLLVLDPDRLDAPHAERLVGDDWVQRARINPLDGGKGLRGEKRGEFAAERAAKLAAESA
jgi:glutamine amidotransferase